MEVFLQGTDVTLKVPLVDKNGNALSVSTITYSVTDQAGTVLVPSQALTYTPGDTDASVTVPAVSNALTAGSTRDMRMVSLLCVNALGNTVALSAAYAVALTDPMQVGINTFQSYSMAEFTSLAVPNTPGWDAANDTDRITALIEARSRICQLNFTQTNSNMFWGQDSLSFVPDGVYMTQYATQGGMFLFNGNIAFLTPEQFVKLPARFLNALYLAQLAEADNILGGDPVEQKRQQGLMLETIGEVKQMFRQGKPLQLPVSRRALSYLSYFVTFSKTISRR